MPMGNANEPLVKDRTVTQLRSSFAAVPSSVRLVRRFLDVFLHEHGVNGQLGDDIRLAVSEACANVVLHAYRDEPGGQMEVLLSLRDRAILVVVRDDGSGIRPRQDSPGLGLGLRLIDALASDVHLSDRAPGAEVRMTFMLPDGTAGQ
jgi:serine/threonine-protein kinase RsbW